MLLAVARPSSSGMGSSVGNFGGVDYQRREREAYNVVDEERGEEAGRRDGHREHAEAGPRAAEQGAREKRERAREAQVCDDDHHPEQQSNRVEVDSALGGGFAERARHNHRDGARQGGAGAIDPRPRNFAERDHRVGQGENDEGQEVAGKHRRIFRREGVGQRRHQRYSSRVSIWKFHSRWLRLDHVVLRCRDQNRAYDFYTRILGLSEERRIEQIGLIQLRAGRSMIDLVPASRSAGRDGTQRRSRMHRDRGSRSERGRALSARTIGRGDGRASDALRGARRGSFDLRARSRGQRRRAQADADRVVSAGAAAGRIARLFSDKQDCRFHRMAANGQRPGRLVFGGSDIRIYPLADRMKEEISTMTKIRIQAKGVMLAAVAVCALSVGGMPGSFAPERGR